MNPAPRGRQILHDPRTNKGTAFTEAERDALGLRGLLPPRVLSIEEQLHRIHANLESKTSAIEKYIFVVSLQDRNETLFYRYVVDHLIEMMPVIYTPTVGQACQTFGNVFRRSRGLYLSIRDRGRIPEVLDNWDRDCDVIVVTDGQRILGLGDLGTFGMGIPIGKLSLYTALAGIDPARCLPVTLDVGCDNAKIREDPLYTGLNQARVTGAEYDDFVEEFVQSVQERWPGVLLQWEDFATPNALRLLETYRDRLCTFNDDVQGTASVAVATLLGACTAIDSPLREQKILFFGAGSAAAGVGSLIVSQLVREGMPEDEARRRIWMVDSKGLIVSSRTDLADYKRPFAQDHAPVPDLASAVAALRPSALLGLSAQPQVFTEAILGDMASHHARPIVFALSNPTSRAECTAEQAYRFTGGRALFASGSPFDPVTLDGHTHHPSQANNAFVFPGIGLGAVLSRSSRIPEEMFLVAAETLAATTPRSAFDQGSLLPPLESIREVSATIAAAIVRYASAEGLATADIPADVEGWVQESMWQPVYPELA